MGNAFLNPFSIYRHKARNWPVAALDGLYLITRRMNACARSCLPMPMPLPVPIHYRDEKTGAGARRCHKPKSVGGLWNLQLALPASISMPKDTIWQPDTSYQGSYTYIPLSDHR